MRPISWHVKYLLGSNSSSVFKQKTLKVPSPSAYVVVVRVVNIILPPGFITRKIAFHISTGLKVICSIISAKSIRSKWFSGSLSKTSGLLRSEYENSLISYSFATDCTTGAFKVVGSSAAVTSTPHSHKLRFDEATRTDVQHSGYFICFSPDKIPCHFESWIMSV